MDNLNQVLPGRKNSWALPSWVKFPIVSGLLLVTVLVFCALFAPVLTRFSPYAVEIHAINAPPSASHWFGTDDLGRDLFSRVVYGARISLWVGVIATLIAITIGTCIGVIAGYFGGWIEMLLMRFTDIVLAFPVPLFAIAVVAPFENPSIGKLFVVLGLIGWPAAARVVRGQVLALKQMDYILAARALGLRKRRILWRHLLPNAIAPILVLTSLMVPGNILAEAWLSFLGLGAQPPEPSWGAMITEGQAYLQSKPWICLFPGLAIFVTVFGFNIFGDGLRDYLDPKLKNAPHML
jgi:ABC-type dipeptide/oligopeptide/nickel transport system permease subunit